MRPRRRGALACAPLGAEVLRYERLDLFVGYRGRTRAWGTRAAGDGVDDESERPVRLQYVVDLLGHHLFVSPMERLTEGDEPEWPGGSVREILSQALDQSDVAASSRCGSQAAFGEHVGIGIETRCLLEEVGQTEGEDGWPAPDVEKATGPVETELASQECLQPRGVRGTSGSIVPGGSEVDRGVVPHLLHHWPLGQGGARTAERKPDPPWDRPRRDGRCSASRVTVGSGHTEAVLEEIADGVLVRQSEFCLSNATVVTASSNALLVDPGVDGDDLTELADDLDDLGAVVGLGFATHPHWDHVLWHARFGDVPRYGTRTCALYARQQIERMRRMAGELAPGAPLDSLGALTALPSHADHLPSYEGRIRVIEHEAHAPGHAALLLVESGVLLAGDMLSDVEIPLFDPGARNQCSTYLAALELLEAACSSVVAVVPGHGSVARGPAIASRIQADRAYVEALRAGVEPADWRVGPDATYGADWLPQAHENNVRLSMLICGEGGSNIR